MALIFFVFKHLSMWHALVDFLLVLSIVMLILLKTHTGYVVKQIDHYPIRLARSGPLFSDYAYNHGPINPESDVFLQKNPRLANSTDHLFSIIIVTFNEPLLYKTYIFLVSFDPPSINNVLTNTDPTYIKEVRFGFFMLGYRFWLLTISQILL